MSEQYFKSKPTSEQAVKHVEDQVAGVKLRLQTDNGVFSKNRMDYGSKVLVESFVTQVSAPTQLLELGSGYGPVALALAKLYPTAEVTGIEVNERAYELALDNQQQNRVSNCHFELSDVREWTSDARYDYIVTNPPIRAGKAVIRHFVDVAYQQLVAQGELWVVIQKKQGAPSMSDYMENLFGNVELVTRDKGYWILKSVKAEA